MADTSISSRPGPVAALTLLARDIKLSHSVFALPFALLGACMATSPLRPLSPARAAAMLLLVVICMVLARTWAMLINRLADAALDAKNPRTSRRVLAAGRVSRPFALATTFLAAALFVASAGGFWLFAANPWPLALSLPVLAWIALYSFTKRFTWACHLFLGSALALSPLAAALAVDPSAIGLPALASFEGGWGAPNLALYALALMVLLWVAGFDIIYALQDVRIDRELGLYSIPSRLGITFALNLSRLFHLLAFLLLIVVWLADPRLGRPFLVGVAAVGALLVLEHLILARRGEAGLHAAFFTCNGLVSLALGTLGIVGIIF